MRFAARIASSGTFVTITVKNTFEGAVVFAPDGLPVTTKEDTDFHGFGMKSIRMIVEKYKGNLSISAKDGVFKVNIFFTL